MKVKRQGEAYEDYNGLVDLKGRNNDVTVGGAEIRDGGGKLEEEFGTHIKPKPNAKINTTTKKILANSGQQPLIKNRS